MVGLRKGLLVLVVGSLVGLAASRPSMISALDPEAIVDVARKFGDAKLERGRSGDPMIFGEIDGTKYGILFFGCNDEGERCKDLLFMAMWDGDDWDVSLRQVNRWNADKRYGRAYLSEEGDVVLDMVVNLRYGVSYRNFEDTFDWWKIALKQFRSEVLE